MSEEDPQYVRIGLAARLSGLHIQTLRVYEQRGLIRPTRSEGGTRLYSVSDLRRLARIQTLADEGINLLGAQRILELEERHAHLEAEVAELRRELQRRHVRQQRQRVAGIVVRLDPDGDA